MKKIYALLFAILLLPGCMLLRMNGSGYDAYLDTPQPIDFYIRPNKSSGELILDWASCGGSIYGLYNWSYFNENTIKKYDIEMNRCLDKKHWQFRYCNRTAMKNEPFCTKYGSISIPLATKREFFQTEPLWKNGLSSVKDAYKACHAQEGRFWSSIIISHSNENIDNNRVLNVNRIISKCLLRQGLIFNFCPTNIEQKKVINNAAGDVEICPLQLY